MGKTPQRMYFEIQQLKHPHGRGEDGREIKDVVSDEETPPRAWGRLRCQHINGGSAGNTPTGVGKTHGKTNPKTGGKKHPHGRGEDRIEAAQAQLSIETPPRAWGRPRGRSTSAACSRNTPTGVGKTVTGKSTQNMMEKHPHGRGEDVPYDIRQGAFRETPPRAWGRRHDLRQRGDHGGNTPTGVGKTA